MRVVGVDIGGTKTAIGLLDFPDARILRRIELPTPQAEASGVAFLDRVAGAIRDLLANEPGAATGVGICELVDRDGAVTSAHRVHWRGLPVQARLEAIAPTTVEADVRAAALAECRWGAGRASRDFLYLNIGTGISTCFVKDGVPYAGARGNALAIASAPVLQSCPACGAESAYILEEVAGGAGLIARYRDARGVAVASASEILQAAQQGEALAKALIDDAARAIGVTLGIALNMLDPEALVIGGGLGGQAGPYWDAMTLAIRNQIWSDQTRALPILQGTLGPDAGLIGAAAAAWLAVSPIVDRQALTALR
jgi:glucokinase